MKIEQNRSILVRDSTRILLVQACSISSQIELEHNSMYAKNFEPDSIRCLFDSKRSRAEFDQMIVRLLFDGLLSTKYSIANNY